jgi:hypothetical protein
MLRVAAVDRIGEMSSFCRLPLASEVRSQFLASLTRFGEDLCDFARG